MAESKLRILYINSVYIVSCYKAMHASGVYTIGDMDLHIALTQKSPLFDSMPLQITIFCSGQAKSYNKRKLTNIIIGR